MCDILANPNVPTPSCKGAKSAVREQRHLRTLMLNVASNSLLRWGGNPSISSLKRTEYPPNKRGVMLSGQLPANKMFIKAVSDLKRTDRTSLQFTRSSKRWGLIPPGPQLGKSGLHASLRLRLSRMRVNLMVDVVVQMNSQREDAVLPGNLHLPGLGDRTSTES